MLATVRPVADFIEESIFEKLQLSFSGVNHEDPISGLFWLFGSNLFLPVEQELKRANVLSKIDTYLIFIV